MALVRWGPWQGLLDLQRDMDDLMRRLTRSWDDVPAFASRRPWVPAVDVFNRDGDLVVRAELPGIDPEKDAEITVKDGVLTIRGERKHEDRSEDNGMYRVESSYGAFERTVLLPRDVSDDDIRASYENGILEVVVPKAGEMTAGKRIPIEAGGSRKTLKAGSRE
jgi:HSP20 family protein